MESITLRILAVFLLGSTLCQCIYSSESSFTRGKDSRLLNFLQDDGTTAPVWKSREEWVHLLKSRSRNFTDLTNGYQAEKLSRRRVRRAFQYDPPSYQSAINPLLDELSLDRMQEDHGILTSITNRFCWGPIGKNASDWVKDAVTEIASARPDLKINITTHNHLDWDPVWEQEDVTLRIPSKNASAPVTILGAHMDTWRGDTETVWDQQTARATGADDDASGAVNLFDILRVLLGATNEDGTPWVPETPLEFHWYSCEELGLLGSELLVREYVAQGVEVKGMLQLDMTLYFKPSTTEIIAVSRDEWQVDLSLTDFVTSLVTEYTLLPAGETGDGNGGSDHQSWHDHGYPSAFVFESRFDDSNPTIHTVNDTMEVEGLSWEHSLEFAKLGLAFAYELTASGAQ